MNRRRAAIQRKRKRIFMRDKGTCYYCGKPVLLAKGRPNSVNPKHIATLDHVVPKSKGGTLHDDNLVLACQGCNNERGDVDARSFMFEKRGWA